MRKYTKPFIIAIFLLLTIIPTVYAASSSDFLSKAQKFINNNCYKRSIANDTSLGCYLFYKVEELEAKVNSNTSRITNLENAPTPTTQPTPQPTSILPQNIEEVTIFPQGNLQNETYSDVLDFSNHKMLVLNCLWTNGTGGIWVYYSNNQNDWELDYRAGCAGNTNNDYKQAISIVKGEFYKFKVVNSFAGEIKAILY